DDDAYDYLVNYANGDIRTALNALELAVLGAVPSEENFRVITLKIIKEAMASRKIAYDKGGEEHYNLISALHKSLRGSDPQAALYWLGRMIEGGADPLYIARRLVRFASEDVGLADPDALVQAIATKDAVDFLGYPECNTALAQCVIYLATAPKSNSVYVSINHVKDKVHSTRNEPVPLNIRNAPTSLMKELDYGKGYVYEHDTRENFSGQEFLPEVLRNACFYTPGSYGFEKEIAKRMQYWKRLKNEISKTKAGR
ncbi:MAG: replication-associated recombination protein A, partial [Oligoflexia bacterium]|nr:replication-associated recombination protein A [Oligoflexia bacterium]